MKPDQIAQIRAFVANKAMFEAVCSVLQPAEEFGLGVVDQDDAEYGRSVRVWVGARDLIKARIAELKRLASTNPQPPTQNQAR